MLDSDGGFTMLCMALLCGRVATMALAAFVFAGCVTEDATPAPRELPATRESSAGLFYFWQFEQVPFDPAESAVADLIRTLETSQDAAERAGAAHALGECCFGFSFRDMRFSWPTREDREGMIAAVRQGRTGTKAKVLVPVLMRAFDDPSPEVRERIAYSFVHIGPVAAEAAPRLRAALEDENVVVRLWSARALHGITLERDLPLQASLAALADPKPKVRTMAVYNLELMGPDARSAVGRLQQLAESDPDAGVRSQAEQAVSSLRR